MYTQCHKPTVWGSHWPAIGSHWRWPAPIWPRFHSPSRRSVEIELAGQHPGCFKWLPNVTNVVAIWFCFRVCSQQHVVVPKISFFLKIQWLISSSFYSMQSWLCRGCTILCYTSILDNSGQTHAKHCFLPESLPPIIIRFPPPRLYTVVDMPGISHGDTSNGFQWISQNYRSLRRFCRNHCLHLLWEQSMRLEPLNHTRQSATSTCTQRHRGL